MVNEDDATGGALVEARGTGRAITPAMRLALSAGAVVFHLGALAQIIAAIWAGWALALVVGAGSLLAQTRGLDERTFETCLWIAAGIDAVLLLALGGVWIDRAVAGDERPAHERRFRERHPVVSSIAWLIGATTIFVVKDADHDVHLAPYHYWHHRPGDQSDLFAAPADPGDASCRTSVS